LKTRISCGKADHPPICRHDNRGIPDDETVNENLAGNFAPQPVEE